jgi:hypothetical protein
MHLSSRDLIHNTIQVCKQNKAYVQLANKNNTEELKAFLQLDKHRFNIKNSLLAHGFADSLEKQKKYAEFSGIKGALDGKN